jgi:methionine sulfoxide reductase heme-binding subunit
VSLLQHRSLNGWPLFILIASLTVVVICAGLLVTGVSSPEATVTMIRLSVQLASPWVYLAFVASALVQLFPGSFSRWLLRNRRYIGLSFAAGFAWQAVFIAVLLALHADYYWQVLHDSTDLILRLLSYMLLLALTVTSFFPVRRAMRAAHWRALHLVGIWYFWAAIWVSYVGVVLEGDTRAISIVYMFTGLLALAVRLTAHLKSRSIQGVESP